MKAMNLTTTKNNAQPARSPEFESVGEILARVIDARGDLFAHRLKKARLECSRVGSPEKHERA
jgi:hypothetical protein